MRGRRLGRGPPPAPTSAAGEGSRARPGAARRGWARAPLRRGGGVQAPARGGAEGGGRGPLSARGGGAGGGGGAPADPHDRDRRQLDPPDPIVGLPAGIEEALARPAVKLDDDEALAP